MWHGSCGGRDSWSSSTLVPETISQLFTIIHLYLLICKQISTCLLIFLYPDANQVCQKEKAKDIAMDHNNQSNIVFYAKYRYDYIFECFSQMVLHCHHFQPIRLLLEMILVHLECYSKGPDAGVECLIQSFFSLNYQKQIKLLSYPKI
ncbi:antibiotic biosynthesis monooxygenase [Striga asiatica]|uniref:Antibiotic biosynthesis monooxygenase n=1 Tax=Striga asiatica TaxID=4170 RepID=A0A5A7PMF3_STRAF|nr:antibiotic biosynthesis monooxygenase [Striga asiatica]